MLNEKIVITIIIPIYNVGPFITSCLQSVFAQTYKGKIECILVDDCGTDNSLAIAQKLVNNYIGPIKFKILHHKKNRGLSAARNTGIDASTGDYLLFLDSDDELPPNSIKDLIEGTNGLQMDIVVGNFEICGGDRTIIKDYKQDVFYSNDTAEIIKYYTDEKLYMMAWNKLVRRSFIKKYNLYFKEGIIHEDVLWSLLVINRASSLHIISTPTYIYNIRDGSITNSMNLQKSFDSWMTIIDEFEKSILVGYVQNTKENRNYIEKKKFEWLSTIYGYKGITFKEKLMYMRRILIYKGSVKIVFKIVLARVKNPIKYHLSNKLFRFHD